MYIRRVKSLNENSKIGNEIISSLQDAVLQEAKKKKRKQSALSPFCYLDREDKKKEPEVKTDAGNVEQGIEFFNSTFNTGETGSSVTAESSAMGESLMFNDILNEIYPNKGEKKGEFISRFMSDENMKKEYPDNKQRLAVAYSYYDRKDEKMGLNEYLFEEVEEAKPLSSIFDTEDKPIVVLVDDARKYDGEWFNREFEKEDLEEDFDETAFQKQEEKREKNKKREKYTVSDKEVQKVLDNIANSYIKVLPTAKNNDFAKEYNLSNSDQVNIVKKLVKSDYQYSTKSDNAFYEGNVLTVFADNLSVKDNSSESVKMYIKVDDTIAGKVMVVSLHKDSDFRNNKNKDRENENMKISKAKNINEANYGGAFDIAEDQFFTREDIDNFSYELVEILKEDFDDVEYISSYLENNEFEITLSWNDWEETVTIPIDMRKIRKPSDLQEKYMMKFVDAFANKFAENKQTEEENLYYVISAYDDQLRGIEDDLTTTSEDRAKEFANEKYQKGYYVVVKNETTGKDFVVDYDEITQQDFDIAEYLRDEFEYINNHD